MALLTRLVISVFALLVVGHFLPGMEVTNLYTAVIAAVILGLLNAFVRPVLFILTLPLTILTFGLFHFVLNAGLFLFAASFIDGFSLASFWVALVASLFVSFITSLCSRFLA